jgi:hypothetical protein
MVLVFRVRSCVRLNGHIRHLATGSAYPERYVEKLTGQVKEDSMAGKYLMMLWSFLRTIWKRWV